MATSFRRRTALIASLALLAACSGEPSTAPASRTTAPGAPSTDLLGSVTNTLGLTLVGGLQRTAPLSADITVSKSIGTAGGTLAIPSAGVTVTIPYGALSTTTVVTMTARKGSLVAYDFAPHGITFAKPLVFTQSLKGTNATLLSAPLLKLGYYSDPSVLTALGGLVSELIGGNVNLLSWTFSSSIRHFSGYMVGCGRGDADM
jgi:hypothetical protein